MNQTTRLWRHGLALFLLALVVRFYSATLIPQPGYMDTAYYTVQAIRLAEGAGATEPYLWNYLNDPQGIPNPAFGYWMPLPSLLAAPFWAVGHSFLAAQLPFVLLAALFVLLGAYIAWESTHKLRHFWAAGLLLIASGSVTPFWSLPETFTPFALCATLCLWAGSRYWLTQQVRWLLWAVVAAGLAYLTRSDGLLLVALTLLLPLGRRQGRAFVAAGAALALLLAPWVLYNLSVHGAPLPTGGTRALWLTNYDDLFCYHCKLTPANYLAWGWPAILHSKIKAFSTNFMIIVLNVGYLFLAPFVVIGSWRTHQFLLRWAWLYLALLFAAMTFAFTFPSTRGSLFHSAVALLPFSVTAALIGLDRTIAWVGQRRKWNINHAQLIFTAATVLIALLVVTQTSEKYREWQSAGALYQPAQAWIAQQPDAACPVLVGDPASFWYATRQPALVIPNEDAKVVAEVAHRYGACWLLLDKNRPKPLADLYQDQQDPVWTLVQQWPDGKLFRLTDLPGQTAVKNLPR
ncbi:MAG: hypothetical protein R3C14_12375 [Caldilineaceae bacterium]